MDPQLPKDSPSPSADDIRELVELFSSLSRGEIKPEQLRAGCAEFAARRPEYRLAAAEWLRRRVLRKKLDTAVWNGVKDLFESPRQSEHAAARTRNAPAGGATVVRAPLQASTRQGPTRREERSTQVVGRAPPRPVIDHSVIDPSDIGVGAVLKNRFVLVEEIGSGGMGRVFKARDRVPEAYEDRHLHLA
ncbi:MAG: hypothetical protein ABW034_16650, partial [Steroidobacteraceae bacterium]